MRAGALAVALLVGLAGCTAPQEPGLWRGGRLVIGTGDTTGVFYQVGAGYAEVISSNLPGYDAISAPTAGAGDNLLRLASGDVDIALTSADVAGEALRGTGRFAGSPPRFRALARIHLDYTHLIVRTGSGITNVAGLRSRRVSTGAPHSGAELVADRLLSAAGLDPARDIDRRSLTLPEATRAMLEGSIDAMFWSAGLPTVGVTELVEKAAGQVRFLPVDSLLPELERRHPGVYVAGSIPPTAYGLPAAVPTVAVPNLLVVAEVVPYDLARELTRLIFEHRGELATIHPDWGNVEPATAMRTDPVPLHSGAARYYDGP